MPTDAALTEDRGKRGGSPDGTDGWWISAPFLFAGYSQSANAFLLTSGFSVTYSMSTTESRRYWDSDINNRAVST